MGSEVYDPLNNAWGTPDTEEEAAWAAAFYESQGRSPTVQELDAWKKTISNTEKLGWTFLNESTTGKMGWGGTGGVGGYYKYGSGRGSLGTARGPLSTDTTPMGWLVLTDENGVPIARVRDWNNPRYSGYISQGYFLAPPESPLYNNLPESKWALSPDTPYEGPGMITQETYGDMYPGESPPPYYNPSEYYPTYDTSPFTPPSMENALGQYSEEQVYLAELEDWLTQQIEKDAPKIAQIQESVDAQLKKLEESYALGGMSNEEYNRQYLLIQKILEDNLPLLMTEEKAAQIAQEAMAAFKNGTPRADLPYSSEVSGTIGAAVQELYNQMSSSMEQTHQAQLTTVSAPRGGIVKEPSQSEFITYVDSLNLAYEFSYWLKNKYAFFVSEWKKAGGAVDFIEWLENYIKEADYAK